MILVVNEHITLTDHRSSDVDALVQHLADQDISEQTLSIPHPYTPADAAAWIALAERINTEQARPLAWAIRNRHDQLIGGCGFKDCVVGQSQQAEIGYWLARPWWGRGIATAVVQALCRYAGADLGLHKLTAHVFAGNRASMRVLEKCGFQLEAYLENHYRKNERSIDALCFGRRLP